MDDRDYYFWIATFALSSDAKIEPRDAARDMVSKLEASSDTVHVSGYELYQDIGDVEFDADEDKVREWSHCLLVELSPDSDISALIRNPPDVIGSMGGMDWGAGVEALTSELTVRPYGAGTALPRANEKNRPFPERFQTAIEYISIPREKWDHYRQFMRSTFGPVGCWMVEHGRSHKIIITESVQTFYRHHTMPEWNRIHFLTGDFDNEKDGFYYWTKAALGELFQHDLSVKTATAPIHGYRKKPKMSKNIVLASNWPAD